ncbi:N-methyl-L-tryptophan oxidase [Lederbergia citrea]|uniref:N-methyl-L-tryptophan oxidase n=1 Tax=Lederbergia citrea TaxID=2833581 RepID=A0A942UQ74_9BACI|nr:N-methyl-L-tryptophan oxidase [Lederbergia citrea]MBS4222918.1 N-methyl-L-tryptophan oxidase [Lederbergia citrea]
MGEKSADWDVAVIGLGSMGSFAFWQLARMGIKVVGFDRYKPGHDHGAGHGESRIFRTAYGEGVEYVPLLKEARGLWRELESETDTELYVETGGTMFGPKEDDFIVTVQDSVEKYHLPHKVYEPSEAKQIYPQINFQDNQLAVFEELAGYVKPELAIETAVKRGIELGGTAFTEHPVTEIEPDTDRVTIRCGDKQIRVKRVIVSAGGWTSKLLPELNLPLSIERQVLVWYNARNPELFAPEKFPIFSRVSKGRGFYGFPSLDGKTVKVAFHHGGEIVDHPEQVDRIIHESDLAPLTEKVKKYLPDLIPEPVRAKTCFYTNTPDEHFVLGFAPGMPNIVLLGPMAGHGFKFAPIMGKIAAELSTNQTPSLEISMFDPSRFKNTKKY